uniref:Hypothetical conserved protein n=1 Tax=Simulium guianense TaxID=445764 RepID=F5GTV0_SIMGU
MDPDRVVTGVRLAQSNSVLYWQLQTGKPRTFGFVDTDTMEWEPLPNVTRQANDSLFHRINIKQSFIMRNLEVPEPYVLTGVQFSVKTVGETTGYDINLFGRQIELMEGKLFNETTKFEANEELFDRYRTENLNTLVNVNKEEVITATAKDKHTIYVVFGHSSIEGDFGQHLVPFFDVRKVTTSVPMPLKGVGLYHRTNEKHAGIIAPRLIAINPVNYLSVFANRTENVKKIGN